MRTSILILSATLILLSACVISVNDGDYDEHSYNWRKQERKNRSYIADLQLGTSEDTVRMALGTPNFSESFDKEGEVYSIYFYRTERVNEDGMTTKDESTPLVFKDSLLIGWGDTVYRSVTEGYDIRTTAIEASEEY